MSEQDSLFKEPGEDPAVASPSQDSTGPFTSQRSAERDMAEQLADAQRQVGTLVVFLLVVSGTLAIFLLQQIRYAKADLTLLRLRSVQTEQAEEFITTYRQKTLPAQQKFVEQLGEYAKTHPDIIPILAKHGLIRRAPASEETAPGENP